MLTSIVVLGAVAALLVALAVFLCLQLASFPERLQSALDAKDLVHAQERADLMNRIQRPEMLQPGPVDRDARADAIRRQMARNEQLARVGTITHAGEEA